MYRVPADRTRDQPTVGQRNENEFEVKSSRSANLANIRLVFASTGTDCPDEEDVVTIQRGGRELIEPN
jgi:hypothetical protein